MKGLVEALTQAASEKQELQSILSHGTKVYYEGNREIIQTDRVYSNEIRSLKPIEVVTEEEQHDEEDQDSKPVKWGDTKNQ